MYFLKPRRKRAKIPKYVLKSAQANRQVNISRYEGHRYAFEIHQYT